MYTMIFWSHFTIKIISIFNKDHGVQAVIKGAHKNSMSSKQIKINTLGHRSMKVVQSIFSLLFAPGNSFMKFWLVTNGQMNGFFTHFTILHQNSVMISGM